MRIGIDCRLWNETGVGRYTRNLVGELDKIDNHNQYVLFVLSRDAENLKSQISNLKNGKWKLVVADIRWHSVTEQLEFPGVLEKENLDLVHFPYFSVPIFYNRPFVVTIHDLILHDFPTGQASTMPYPFYWLKHFGYKAVISSAAKRAFEVIAVSEATKKDIVDHLHVQESKVAVTYEGVDAGIVGKNKNNHSLVKSDYFLFVGNAYPHKNLDRLFSAFRQIRVKNPAISLVLVGREDYFYRRLRKQPRDGVLFLTASSDKELQNLYRNAKALIMPSLMEGFGLPPLEAMSNDCVVLASDIPSFREICNNAAIYFDPYDSNSIASVMQSVLASKNKKQLDELKEIGKKHASTFSWEKMAKETLAVYESCLSV